jgi:Na+-transporting NADH:ubiquinone oxidoreductase subunit NqrC
MKFRTGSTYSANGTEDPQYELNTKLVIVALLLCAVFLAVLFPGCKSYQRYQKRADANNQVKVTAIMIRKAQQEAKIVQARNSRVLTLGTETIGGKTLPFVALCREGSKHQVIVHFRDKDKTAEARRSYEGKSGPVVKRPPVAKKPAAVAKK